MASIKPGGGGDYLSFNAWEAAISGNPTVAQTASLDEKANGNSGNLDIDVSNSNNVDITLTVGSGYRFNQEANWPSCADVEGVAGRIEATNQDVIDIDTSNVIVEYLEIRHTSSGSNVEGAQFSSGATTGCIVRYCMIHDVDRIGILMNSANPAGEIVHHCFIYNCDDDGVRKGAATTGNLENCTIFNNGGYGVQLALNNASCVINCDNNVVLDNTSGDFTKQASASWGTSDYNMSSDATAPGTNTWHSVTSSNIIVNTTGGSEDLHMKSANDGTYEGSTGTGSVDIDGDSRSDWDIGADELVAAATTTSTTTTSTSTTTTTTSTTTTSTTTSTTTTSTTSTTTTSTSTTTTTTSTTSTSTTTTSTTTTSTSTTSTTTSTTSTTTTTTSTTTTSTSTTTTSTTTTSTSTTTSVSTTTATTFTFQYPHGFVEGWESTSSTSSTTTTQPGYSYLWGIPRKSGLTYPSAEKIPVELPAATATDLDPFSLKTFVDFDGNVGIFDGAGANRLDDGSSLLDFTELAPEHVASVSSTTSTTSTSTTTTTTSTTTTSTTTTVP